MQRLSIEAAFAAACDEFRAANFKFGDPEEYLHPPGHPHHYRPDFKRCEQCVPPVHGQVELIRAAEGLPVPPLCERAPPLCVNVDDAAAAADAAVDVLRAQNPPPPRRTSRGTSIAPDLKTTLSRKLGSLKSLQPSARLGGGKTSERLTSGQGRAPGPHVKLAEEEPPLATAAHCGGGGDGTCSSELHFRTV